MLEDVAGAGRFVAISLKPVVTIALGGDLQKARQVYEAAHSKCFVANSLNFPVRCEPPIRAAA